LINVNPGFVANPNGVFNETFPLEPEPTIARIVESLSVKNEAAAVLPKAREVVPVKCVPTIKIVSPLWPLAGAKKVIVGAKLSWPVESTNVKELTEGLFPKATCEIKSAIIKRFFLQKW